MNRSSHVTRFTLSVTYRHKRLLRRCPIPEGSEGDGWVNWSGLATMFGEFGNLPVLIRVLAL
jgi:hypothetical protein